MLNCYPEMNPDDRPIERDQEGELFKAIGPRLWCLISWIAFYEETLEDQDDTKASPPKSTASK